MKVFGMFVGVIAAVVLIVLAAGFGTGVMDVVNTVAPAVTPVPEMGEAKIIDLHYYGQVAGQYVANWALPLVK